MKNKNEIISKILKYSFPVIIQDGCSMLLQLVDSAMVGHLGAVAIAAVAINVAPMWLISGIGTALSTGCGALISRSVGAKDESRANGIACLSLLLSSLLGISAALVFFFTAPLITRNMGAAEDVLDLAVIYIRIIAISYIFQYFNMILGTLFRSIGKFKTPMAVNLLMGIFNVFGNFFMIYPGREISLGRTVIIYVPGMNLGVPGAALASLFSTIFAAILLFALFCRQNMIDISIRNLKIVNTYIWKKIGMVCIPILGESMITSIGQIVFFRSVASMGTVLVAANSLAIEIEAISYTPAYGFAAAATTLTGISLGKCEKSETELIAKESWKLGMLYMSFCGMLFLLFPAFFLSIFTGDKSVIAEGMILVRLLSVMQPFFATKIIFEGVLKGAGDTKDLMKVAIICKGMIRIFTTECFVYWCKWGIVGAWISMIVDQLMHGVLVGILYLKGKWKRAGRI